MFQCVCCFVKRTDQYKIGKPEILTVRKRNAVNFQDFNLLISNNSNIGSKDLELSNNRDEKKFHHFP